MNAWQWTLGVGPVRLNFDEVGTTPADAMLILVPLTTTTEPTTRCTWEPWRELMLRYHDEEWGVPSHDDRHLFEMLTLEGAQAGLSWTTILNKRENYRRAFNGFDIDKVAHYGEADINRLLADAGIVRNRAKIDATSSAPSIPTSGASSAARPGATPTARCLISRLARPNPTR